MTVYTVVHLPRYDDYARAILWVDRVQETSAELVETVDKLCLRLIGLGDWYVEVSLHQCINLAVWIAQPYPQYRLLQLAMLASDNGDNILARQYDEQAESYTLSPHLVAYFVEHVAFIALHYNMKAHTQPGHPLVYCGRCAKSYWMGLVPEYCERCGTMEYTDNEVLARQNAAEPYTEHLIRQWQKPEVRARFKSQEKNKTLYGAWRWNGGR